MLPSMYEYFLAAAETRNFTKAAEKLHIAQQTLSSGIARLEELYGVRLFERKPRLSLTYAGQSLQKDLTNLLLLEEQITKKMQDFKSGVKSRLNIGIGMLRGQVILPQILRVFIEKCGNCEVHIYENDSETLKKDILEGRTDLMIHSSVMESKEVRSIAFAEEKIVLLIRDDLLRTYCADHVDEIINYKNVNIPFPITYLNDCPFIYPDEGANLYKRLQAVLTPDFRPRIVVTSKNHATIFRMAELGIGAAFSTSTQAEVLSSDRIGRQEVLHIIPYTGFGAVRKIYITFPRNRYLSNAAKDFIRVVLEQYDSQIDAL